MRRIPALLLASLCLSLGLAAPAYADGETGGSGTTSGANGSGTQSGNGGMWWPP